jgi:hypothetical protein
MPGMLVIQWSSFIAGFEKSVGNRTFLNIAHTKIFLR